LGILRYLAGVGNCQTPQEKALTMWYGGVSSERIFEDWETTRKYTSGYPSAGYKKVVGGQLEAFLLLEKNCETVI